MSKKYIHKDQIKRQQTKLLHSTISQRLLINCKQIPLNLRYRATKSLIPLENKYHLNKPKNRCMLGYRGRAVYRRWGLGRHFILKLVSLGKLTGYTKFSK